jgi:lipoprotein-anchoring transpeptidase ErfK/SrfK
MSAELPGRRRRTRIALALALGVAAAGGFAAVTGSPAPDPSAAMVDWVAPDPVQPAFAPPPPRQLAESERAAVWAPVRRTVPARAQPDIGSDIVDVIETKTPEGTDNPVLVLGRKRDDAGRLWVEILIPAIPRNARAWVQRTALGGYTIVTTHLHIDLERLRVTLYRAGRSVFSAPAAVGKPAWPTPRGRFYIRNRLTRFASPAYGPLAFGTSARSAVLTDWPGGGFIGIHGTNEPWLVPGRVSHGCVRLRNADLLRLAKLMPIGTPVTIA